MHQKLRKFVDSGLVCSLREAPFLYRQEWGKKRPGGGAEQISYRYCHGFATACPGNNRPPPGPPPGATLLSFPFFVSTFLCRFATVWYDNRFDKSQFIGLFMVCTCRGEAVSSPVAVSSRIASFSFAKIIVPHRRGELCSPENVSILCVFRINNNIFVVDH